MYKDIFIDFDDTLYDTKGNAILSLAETFVHFHLGKYFAKGEDFYVPYWKTNVELWDQYAKGQIERDYLMVERFRRPLAEGRDKEGHPFEPTVEFCMQVSDVFLDYCASKPGVVKDAHEVVDYLRGKGYRLHLCSNGFHEVQYRKLRASGLLDFFDTVILSEDAGVNKPSADFFAYALRESGAKVEQTLMIGDNFVTDIQGARAAGIDAMFFNRYPDDFQAPERVEYEITKLEEAIGLL